tara:strand:- start:593 stop:1669 length:1077 start_codon:yes stop_codon:yes gene_type:complete
MAYQNVGTPRFFVNTLEWANYLGFLDIPDLFRTLPITPILTNNINSGQHGAERLLLGERDGINRDFVAILGHNMTTVGWLEGQTYDDPDLGEVDMGTDINRFSIWNETIDDLGNYKIQLSNLKNLGDEWIAGDYDYQVPHDGFTIASFDGSDIDSIAFEIAYSTSIGSIVVGTFYDMPHSPDFSLTLSREYGGVKNIETRGGASLSNTMWHKPPNWGALGAWELYTFGQDQPHRALTKSGRRIWDLSFSYIQDSDIFPQTSSVVPYGSYSATGEPWTDFGNVATNGWWDDNTLLDADTFYNQVIHKTNGGQLPFIFQPDNTNNNPDQFAICKLDMKTFQFTQVANGVYNIDIKIREVW